MKRLQQTLAKLFLVLVAGLITLGAVFTSPVLADEVTVKMGADNGMLAFVPSTVEIKAGDTVKWTNNKLAPHNVVFEGNESAKFSHKQLAFNPGESFSVAFENPGEYTYYCEPHRGAGMVGKVVVK